MKILVTGGSGFTGRNLVEGLRERYEVLAPRHNELELLDEDAVGRFLEKNKIDVVVHAAIKPVHRNATDFSDLLSINLRLFFNLARRKQFFRKLIYISSGSIYDMRHYQSKMREEYSDTHVPCDDTGLLKYIVAKYIEKTDNFIELRPFGLFGRYEDYAIRFISNMICKAIFDLPLTMHQNRKFDYVYINDFARVVDYFVNHEGKHKAYNVTPDASIELCKLAQLVLKVSGKQLPIVAEKEEMGLEYSGDNGRLRQEIPDLAFTPIEESVKQLYLWYLGNRQTIDRNALLIDK